MNENFIIGLTGSFGAGSTTTTKLLLTLKEDNFEYFSLSQFVKDKARQEVGGFDKLKEKEKRIILQDIGDDLRKTKSLSFLVDRIIDDIDEALKTKNVVIDSIRNDEEVRILQKRFTNFFLFAIDASKKNRWNRMKKLYADDDVQFNQDDKRDAGGDDQPDYGQQVSKCMRMADVLINNDRDFNEHVDKIGKNPIEEYGQKLGRYIKLIKQPGFKAPSFDELYMHHAYSVGLRSVCLRRQVGAVIVRECKKNIQSKGELHERDVVETYLIASGCNNVPASTYLCGPPNKDYPDCYRKICKKDYASKNIFCKKCGAKLNLKDTRCNSCKEEVFNFPGKILDLCRAIHAEEAAILQSSKLGIPIDSSVLYTSTFPCLLCSKMIISSGIKKIIYLEPYPGKESLAMLESCGILVVKYEGINSRAFVRLFNRKIED